MRIAFDLDNTLNNLQEVVINIFNKRYGTKYTINDFRNYNVAECLTKEEATNMKAIYSEAGIYNLVKPLPVSQNTIQKLKKAGHEIYIVTHSIPSIFAEKVEWIKYHFEIDEAHIIAMQHKWLFNADIMIEDNMDNLLGGYHYYRVCFTQPWNKPSDSGIHDEAYGIRRISHWNEGLSVINKICNEECC